MGHVPPHYAYRPTPDLTRPDAAHPVVIVGAGLVGLTLALDLAQRGVRSVVLDEDDTASTGSRAICVAKRSLEIFDRLGLGERMLDKGVVWNTGRVFFRERQIYDFDLLPEPGHHYPAFINLQQYYAEEWLVEACEATGLIDLRWRSRVTAVDNRPDGPVLQVETPDGPYSLHADWLLACDGARSTVRHALGLDFVGRTFRDRFLIADVVMHAPFPTERWFWFDPPFHPGQSVLLHKQPDDVWRIDFQLGWDADPELERQPERVIPRVQAMLGADVEFELEWVSIYTFRCRRLERFVHGRTIFAGDAAHQVSPFGARGGNGGVQDADNLAWKLAAVLAGQAGPELLDTYDAERIAAADENILHSTRSTDFITPKSPAVRAYRDAALVLAERFPFARPLINSGRLSRPAVLHESPLHPPGETWPGAPLPGEVADDAPVECQGRPDWLLRHLAATPGFTLLEFGPPVVRPPVPAARVVVTEEPADDIPGATVLHDVQGLVEHRYGGSRGRCVLLRPDQHIAACFGRFDAGRIAAAIDHALARTRRALVA
jgi:3-(3-hydroxy-phenyl)propionate hydroxylase